MCVYWKRNDRISKLHGFPVNHWRCDGASCTHTFPCLAVHSHAGAEGWVLCCRTCQLHCHCRGVNLKWRPPSHNCLLYPKTIICRFSTEKCQVQISVISQHVSDLFGRIINIMKQNTKWCSVGKFMDMLKDLQRTKWNLISSYKAPLCALMSVIRMKW